MNEANSQIPLKFKQPDNFTFTNFIVESNTSTLESLHLFAHSSAYVLYLWGESGVGKTHLVNAFVAQQNQLQKPAGLICPKDLLARENVSLIEMFDYICLDDAQEISGDKDMEQRLFFWINEIKQAQKKIIIASQIPNTSKDWHLPDLRSRLASGITGQLLPLSRQGVLHVFLQQAIKQGMHIDTKAMQYIEKNCPMNMVFLQQLLKQLDRVTLIHKKHVTIPLIKSILTTGLVK